MLGGTARRIVLVFQKDSWLSKKVDFYYLSRVEDALESPGNVLQKIHSPSCYHGSFRTLVN